MTNSRQILLDARQILAESGWHKGSNMLNVKGLATHDYSEAVSYCLLGAIFAAARKHEAPGRSSGTDVANLVSKTLWPALPPHRAPPLHTWNDKKERTKDEVLQVLDETIARTV